jgi:hypothetical protein
VGISALVPFHHWIAGTHYGRFTHPSADPPWGTALGCTVMCAALGTVIIHGEYGHAVAPLIVAGLSILVGWIIWHQRRSGSA